MVMLAEHIGDDLSIFQGKRDIQVGCRFPFLHGAVHRGHREPCSMYSDSNFMLHPHLGR